MRTLALCLAVCLSLVVAACGGKKSNDPPPPQPPTGAPIAFLATSLKAGGDHGGQADVKAYNFSDKDVAQYTIVLRYKDASGKVLKVRPGTPFEKDFDFTSLSGRRYKCEAKSWCSFTLEMLDVPADAKTADVLAARVTALKGDSAFEDKPLFELPGGSMEWPAAVK